LGNLVRLRNPLDFQETSLLQEIWLALPHEITFKAGYSKGFDCNREDFVRLAVEVEF